MLVPTAVMWYDYVATNYLKDTAGITIGYVIYVGEGIETSETLHFI